MARSSPSKQREPGLQAPLRPAVARLRPTPAEVVTTAATDPDWTAAASLLLVGIDQEFMDDRGVISVTSEILTLGAGIWHVHFAPTFRMGTIGASELSLAITSGTGATEYSTLERLTRLAAEDDTDVQYSLDAFFHLTASTVIELRAVSTAANTTISDEEYIGYVQLIGNKNET